MDAEEEGEDLRDDTEWGGRADEARRSALLRPSSRARGSRGEGEEAVAMEVGSVPFAAHGLPPALGKREDHALGAGFVGRLCGETVPREARGAVGRTGAWVGDDAAAVIVTGMGFVDATSGSRFWSPR